MVFGTCMYLVNMVNKPLHVFFCTCYRDVPPRISTKIPRGPTSTPWIKKGCHPKYGYLTICTVNHCPPVGLCLVSNEDRGTREHLANLDQIAIWSRKCNVVFFLSEGRMRETILTVVWKCNRLTDFFIIFKKFLNKIASKIYWEVYKCLVLGMEKPPLASPRPSHYEHGPWTTMEALPWDFRHPHWQLLEVCNFWRSEDIEGVQKFTWSRPRPFCP